ncbi:hypothetical protein LCGC14_0582460 [marine sediment metagenome]|uniref:Uncharacterized protein n=1 Tax=marine sediment metagenome TaxID=412755 RepID=A0A0F9RL02_9ZZZZ
MDKTTMIVIAVIAIVVIGFIFKKLMDTEVKKNDPTLADPRDSDTLPGNQGIRHTREK